MPATVRMTRNAPAWAKSQPAQKRCQTEGTWNGDLPGAAVVAIAANDFLPLDDDRRVCLRAHPDTSVLTRGPEYQRGMKGALISRIF
jgi:hypothetical protein